MNCSKKDRINWVEPLSDWDLEMNTEGKGGIQGRTLWEDALREQCEH